MNSRPKSILIVDDSEAVRSVVRIFLERDATFIVCGEAASGLEAITKAQELKPDFVLLDLRLHGMSGVETAALLKAALPETKLILFSAYTDTLNGRNLASAAGVDLVVPKGSLIDMAASLKTLAADSA